MTVNVHVTVRYCFLSMNLQHYFNLKLSAITFHRTVIITSMYLLLQILLVSKFFEVGTHFHTINHIL